MRRLLAAAVAVGVVAALAACGGESGSPTGASEAAKMQVAEGEATLRSILQTAGVELGSAGTKPGSLASAWGAFAEFAAVEVARGELEGAAESDLLLYETGAYPSVGASGELLPPKTFEMSFVRQFVTADGDFQQVHLDAYFPVAAFRDLGAVVNWSPGLAGDDAEEARTSWQEGVEADEAFGRALAYDAGPLRYEVWQESAE